MNTIRVDYHTANVCVVTKHEQILEFLLHAAEDRNRKELCYYSDQLFKMIAAELKPYETAQLHDSQVYGHVNFTIGADTREELDKAIAACDPIVSKWIRKYHINQMERKGIE